MLGIKKINNNFALCCDSSGVQMIAYGKGVGFGTFPREIPLGQIESTYYSLKPEVFSLIETVQEEIFDTSQEIIRYAQQISQKSIPSNFVFSLADHIQFAIERHNKNIQVQVPFVYEIEHLYETEYQIGKYALQLIQRRLHVRLPKDEIFGIALHFINNYEEYSSPSTTESTQLMDEILSTVEQEMQVQIDRSSYDCYRFAAHMRYFVKRAHDHALYASGDNTELYKHFQQKYPQVYHCMNTVLQQLQKQLDIQCSEEEQLYLMIHIHRLCANEDCHRV